MLYHNWLFLSKCRRRVYRYGHQFALRKWWPSNGSWGISHVRPNSHQVGSIYIYISHSIPWIICHYVPIWWLYAWFQWHRCRFAAAVRCGKLGLCRAGTSWLVITKGSWGCYWCSSTHFRGLQNDSCRCSQLLEVMTIVANASLTMSVSTFWE